MSKPIVSSTASDNFFSNCSYVEYGGKSMRLKQVCAFGNRVASPIFSMQNLRGPSEPIKSLNPFTGIRDVPVTNCNNRAFFSFSKVPTHFQNH